MMPKIAEGTSNKLWIVPSEIGKALEGLGSTMNELKGIPDKTDGVRTRVDMGGTEASALGAPVDGEADAERRRTSAAVEEAIAEAQKAANPNEKLQSSTTPTEPPAPTEE